MASVASVAAEFPVRSLQYLNAVVNLLIIQQYRRFLEIKQLYEYVKKKKNSKENPVGIS